MIYYIALKDGTKKLVAYEYKKYITFNNDYFHVCPEFKKPSYSELKAVEDAAEKIRYGNLPYTDMLSALNAILSEFIKTATSK